MPRACEVMLVQLMEQPILAIQAKTDMAGLSRLIGQSFAKISAYMLELDVLMTDLPFVAYRNYITMTEKNIIVSLGFPVAKALPGRGDIQPDILPACQAITCMHRGSYDELGATYEDMNVWMRENNCACAGVAFESYYNGPEWPERDLLTRITLPIKPAID